MIIASGKASGDASADEDFEMAAPANNAPNRLFVTTAPQVTESEAASLVRDQFGITGRARLLTSERDRNFHLVCDDGREFVLKVMNAAEDPAVSNLQTEALRHIERVDPRIPVPRVYPTLEGQVEAVIVLESGSKHLIRLLTFLPGEPLYKTSSSSSQVAELGRTLATIDLALRDFSHPAASHDLLWDLKGAAKLRPLLPHIADPRRRLLATRGLDHYEQHLQQSLASFRSQIVHNDYNPHNVLVDPHDPTRVTGVLDFGDIVETPLVNDVAVAASYQVEGQDPFARAAAFVAAFHAVFPLLPEEIDSLFDLIALRQIMTVTITEWRASLYPDNRAYILRNQPRAAAALEILEGIGRENGRARLRQACNME